MAGRFLDAGCTVGPLARRRDRLDVLFNAAGLFVPAAPIDEIRLDVWRRAVAAKADGML